MPFPSTDAQLDALLDEIGVLAGRPRQLQELSGGLTNCNVKVTTPDGVYVARCVDTSNNFLAIDRDDEYHNSVAAERAGVGAPVIDYRPDLGILLLGYLNGKTLSNADFQRPEVLTKVAAGCRALHSGPRFRNCFDMFERQPSYLKTVLDNGFKMPSDYLEHGDTFGRIRDALRAIDQATVPCNNDLLAENFIEDGDRVWIIDYEYSGNNDPCFELGNTWAECGLTTDQLDELVAAYYGRTLRHKTARAHLQGIVGRYGWTLWGCIQSATSALDFDFWSWGIQRYEAAVAEFKSPHIDRLLEDAHAED
ncbi:choline kinase [Mycobacterium sp. ACS1612]|uniref:choline/ethanolamine kinase family protein n=1 Tax=Mycobacterium sp. ACS1612 TaxID=1834117 RepID=UPI0007FE8A49|nr:choline/ethanolamine kinase family protein [Mycobacterium sp. ACS1612]OBF36706.1 choline kinase [Mycobacterium sp. ACS1612]